MLSNRLSNQGNITESIQSSSLHTTTHVEHNDDLFSYMASEEITITTNHESMLLAYLATPVSSLEPLNYWADQANQLSFAAIYQLHRKHHCIPATSANVERVFSSAGYIASARRNRLSDETLEMLLFAKCNSDKLLSIKY